MTLQKQKPWRSKKYLRWIREQYCCACGNINDIQAHHLISVGLGGAMGSKADDFLTIPLCVSCHTHLHRNIHCFIDQNRSQQFYFMKTISKAIKEGGLDGFERWADGLDDND